MNTRINTLFICSRNRWRSPTAEKIYADDNRLNVRSRGLSPSSRCQLRCSDLEWADIVFVMESHQRGRFQGMMREALGGTPIHVLDIPDDYQYMDPELVELLKSRIDWHFRDLDEE